MRIYATVFAIILSVQSAWLIAAEVLRPGLPYFPDSAAQARQSETHISAAAMAAYVGWPRGELWVDYAHASNAALLAYMQDGTARPSTSKAGVARYSARIAPVDARAWLILAALNSQSSAGGAQAQAQLKTSYYTAPFAEALFPIRIQVAARSPFDPDEELRSFVDYEVKHWLRIRPDDKRPIALAYRDASAPGRKLLGGSLEMTSPALLKELRTTYP